MQDNRQFFIALCTTFVHNYSEYCFQYNWIDIFRLENWLDFYCFAAYDPLRSSYSICLYQRIQWIKRQNFWRISTSIIRIYHEHQDYSLFGKHKKYPKQIQQAAIKNFGLNIYEMHILKLHVWHFLFHPVYHYGSDLLFRCSIHQ